MIEKFQKFLLDTPAWMLVLMTFALVLFKTGVWYFSIDIQVRLAENPFANPAPNAPGAQYLMWNWLGPFLAWIIGAQTKFKLVLFHLFFSIAFSVLFTWTTFSRFPDKIARKSLMLFAILPVSGTAYFWVGMDAITLFLMLSSLIWSRLALLLGFALGLQHFEQAFFGALGLLGAVAISLRMGRPAPLSLRFCMVLLAGVVLGKLFLIGLFHYFHMEGYDRLWVVITHFRGNVGEFILHFQFIIWSILGLGWVVFLRYIDVGRGSLPFVIPFVLLCGFSIITEDQTRVVCIITFPLIAAYWLFNEEFLNRISDRVLSMVFLIWAMMPWTFAWAGTPRWSALPYDIVYVVYRIFGFHLPADITGWPSRLDYWK
jgi:hypothetical protein